MYSVYENILLMLESAKFTVRYTVRAIRHAQMPPYARCLMKKLALIFSVLATAAPAFAGPCVALDYQEMKDMSADELTKALCMSSEARRTNMDQVMTNLDSGSGPKPFPLAQDNFDQCSGQIERIERVLNAKGITKELLKDACSRQAAGQIVKAPAEAK